MVMNGYKTGLIGHPLKHSYSVIIHNMLGDSNYTMMDILSEDLEKTLYNSEYKGFNITIPYKKDVLKYLDYVEDKASQIGSVNTIIKGHKMCGYNTDYNGFYESLDYDVFGLTCAILGTGGVSVTVAQVLKDKGAKTIYYVSRTKKDSCITYDELKQKAIDVIINTTPVGMYPNINQRLISLDDFPSIKYIYDLIYNPLNTILIQDAKERNIKCKSGLEMLIRQAIVAHNLICNDNKNNYREIYKALISQKLNIVLIGLPGSGKSTIGKLLSEQLQKTFIDVDHEIEKKSQTTINEIFSNKGESYFRILEANIIQEQALKMNTVIATGGGAVLYEDNMRLLKGNSIVIYLQRNLQDIIINNERPLLTERSQLQKLYNERHMLYLKYADVCINNNTYIDTIMKIINYYNEVINESNH